jgi:hypothetical protein
MPQAFSFSVSKLSLIAPPLVGRRTRVRRSMSNFIDSSGMPCSRRS